MNELNEMVEAVEVVAEGKSPILKDISHWLVSKKLKGKKELGKESRKLMKKYTEDEIEAAFKEKFKGDERLVTNFMFIIRKSVTR